MIDIENSTLEYFEDFKKRYNTNRYQEHCNDFDLRKAIREDLLNKQKGQCAYCEKKLDNDKHNFHIEHIQPRDKDHTKECEYSNLVLSCDSDNSCGKFKDKKEWRDNFIHPVLNNPTQYFEFSFDGKILAINNDNNAEETIKHLNLNSKNLIRLRKNISFALSSMDDIEDVFNYFKEFENLIFKFKNTQKD